MKTQQNKEFAGLAGGLERWKTGNTETVISNF